MREVQQDKSQDELPGKEAVEAMRAGPGQGLPRNINEKSRKNDEDNYLNHFALSRG
jgi:hypothetical protein